ncbi:MAG: nitrogenase [Salinivirgaceae bacterium]|jgi:nitrogenase molybdenum-iron protein NifN|nr:nitrogenase [Salinivirgaceae bacterium]
MTKPLIETKAFTATRNACKLCAPLGASMAFKGIQGCVPIIHGSQGCSTYVRRYLISHFKEPVDIASSNFSEESTIFGGGPNLKKTLENVGNQYKPVSIGISTTCLSETIGDDVPHILKEFRNEIPELASVGIAHAATPSYCGTHVDGFHQAVVSIINQLAGTAEKNEKIVLLPGLLSPADYRYLKEIFDDLGIEATFVPDLSETLDNPHWDEYKRIPDGGTTPEELMQLGGAKCYLQFGEVLNSGMVANAVKKKNINTPGAALENKFGMPGATIGLPFGINATDRMFEIIEKMTGKTISEKYEKERGRLVDAYTDGHKYVFGKRAVIYGEEDFVIGLTEFLTEIGVEPVIIASGGESNHFRDALKSRIHSKHDPHIMKGADFEDIAEVCRQVKPDIMIGHSKGYYIARELEIPLIRVGFPIHDRLGGQRVLHVGYEGAHRLFENIANALIEYKQEHSPVGYKYM